MAVRSQEQEILAGGCKLASPSDGQYVQNMFFWNGAWHVRKGFGQVTQLDTLLCAFNASDDGATVPHGYERHLGSHLIETAFGNQQVVSVFTGRVRTSTLPKATNTNTSNHYLPVYLVSIYDLTTDSRWEEPLYKHTSEISSGVADALDMQFWHAHYETNVDQNNEKWIVAANPQPFFFVEFEGVLYFGNSDSGIYTYFPATFRYTNQTGNEGPTIRTPKHSGIDSIANKPWATPYGESSVIVKAVASRVDDNVDYLEQSAFPKASIATTYSEAGGGSIVYVEGRTIFFTEAGADGSHPTAIPVHNTFLMPSDEDITAIAEQAGNLLIWTANSTWLFKPGPGFYHVLGSRLIKLSDSIGCVGQNTVVKGPGVGALYWMDKNGCYQAATGAGIQKISGDIDPFFTEYITNPLNHYFSTSGQAILDGSVLQSPPRTMLKLDPTGVNGVYWAEKQLVLFSVPAIDTILVWHLAANTWAIWSTESSAMDLSAAATLGALRNMPNPWLLANNDDLFMVTGPEGSEHDLANTTLIGGTGSADTTKNIVNRSYSILRYGLGGAVDRSHEEGEDQRVVMGNWIEQNPHTFTTQKDHTIIFGKPIPMQPGQTVGGTSAVLKNSVWLPVYYVKGIESYDGTEDFGNPEKFLINFTFDNTHWRPLGRDSTSDTEPAWEAPPERVASRSGWGYGTPVHHASDSTLGRKVVCYDGTTPDITGNRIVMSFDPAFTQVSPSVSAISTSTDWPSNPPRISAQKGQITRLMYIPFSPITDDYVVGMGITVTLPQVWDTEGDGASNFTACGVYVWEQAQLRGSALTANSKAQPVTWLYRGQDIALKQDARVRARGSYTRLLSHGSANKANSVSPDWPYGLYNTLIGSDLKGWTTQIIDVAPDTFTENTGQSAAVQLIADTTSGSLTDPPSDWLRTRFKRHKAAGTGVDGATAKRVFGSDADSSPTYAEAGSAGDASPSKRYLIDDEEINTMSVSASVQGDSVSYLVFGFLRNKAEKLIVESVKAALRVLPSGRRRRGR